jgi:hypothetical protein
VLVGFAVPVPESVELLLVELPVAEAEPEAGDVAMKSLVLVLGLLDAEEVVGVASAEAPGETTVAADDGDGVAFAVAPVENEMVIPVEVKEVPVAVEVEV